MVNAIGIATSILSALQLAMLLSYSYSLSYSGKTVNQEGYRKDYLGVGT